jgi:hypothetical protein
MKEKVLRSGATQIPNLLTSNMISMTKALLIEKSNAQKTNQTQNNLIEFPAWQKDRQFMSWDFYPNPEKFEAVILLFIFMQKNFFPENFYLFKGL